MKRSVCLLFATVTAGLFGTMLCHAQTSDMSVTPLICISERIGLSLEECMKEAPQEETLYIAAKPDEEKITRTVNLTDGATLNEMLGDSRYEIDSLIITGYLPQSDFATLYDMALWGCMTGLNMQDCQVEGDSIPSNAFNYVTNFNGAFYREETHGALTRNKDICLNYIVLPKGLTEIGDSAFLHKDYYFELDHASRRVVHLMGDIELPQGLRRIGDYAFGCHSSLYNNRLTGTLSFPESIEYVGVASFSGNNFSKVILPAPSVTVGERAFCLMTKLEEVVIPEGTKTLADGLFYYSNLNAMEQLVLPESIEELGESCFRFSKLKNVVLPPNLKKIPDWCFWTAPLCEINLPEGLEEIGDEAFVANNFLPSELRDENYRGGPKEIIIPNNVRTIGRCAFQIHYFEQIHLPANLTQIGVGAFETKGITVGLCQEVYMSNPVPPTLILDEEKIDKYAIFKPLPSYQDLPLNHVVIRRLHVPEGSKEVYTADKSWGSEFFEEIVEEGIVDINSTEMTTENGFADIHDFNGRPFGKVKITDGRPDTSTLRSGVYVIRMGGKATKVVVK